MTARTATHTRSFVTWIWEWTKSIVVALVVWFFLRTFLVEAFRIPSGSMENTLLVGDFLFVNKALYGAEVPLIHARLPAVREPERSDILVFDSVEDEGLKVVKRLIGMPGDTLYMEDGQLYRDGQRVNEPYAMPADPQRSEDPIQRAKMREWQLRYLVQRNPTTYQPDLQDWGPIVVPADSFFMMGDNRDSSYDGRYWGFLPRANVRGRPLVVYFSYDASSWRALPFFTAVRWGRIFAQPE
ncbi:MAG: signal peptidase I [Gemmatimonadales bacterium]|nr:signal peptidase I [Gemmatimonadales bacterium]MDQ3427065.1 signal peptidase I [Gemmatimonadota bacterium]